MFFNNPRVYYCLKNCDEERKRETRFRKRSRNLAQNSYFILISRRAMVESVFNEVKKVEKNVKLSILNPYLDPN